MAKERKTRQARKKIDTSSLKEFGAGEDFKSRGQQKLAFAKTVKEEADREARLIMKYRAEVQGIREIIGDLISRRNELQRTVKSLEALPKASVYIPPYRRK